MIDKRVKSLAEAVSGIADGATILCAGFGGAGLPDALCEAVVEQGARDLTVVANNAGTGRRGLAALTAVFEGSDLGLQLGDSLLVEAQGVGLLQDQSDEFFLG